MFKETFKIENVYAEYYQVYEKYLIAVQTVNNDYELVIINLENKQEVKRLPGFRVFQIIDGKLLIENSDFTEVYLFELQNFEAAGSMGKGYHLPVKQMSEGKLLVAKGKETFVNHVLDDFKDSGIKLNYPLGNFKKGANVFIGSDTFIEKDQRSIASTELDGASNWKFNLDDLITEKDKEKYEDQVPKIYTDVKIWGSSLIFSAGFLDNLKLYSVNKSSGKLEWAQSEGGGSLVFKVYENYAYYINVNFIIKVNINSGGFEKIDIENQNQKIGIKPLYDFNIMDNYILLVDDSTLKFALFNVKSREYDFFHEFKKGKDINKKTWQILIPNYVDSRIFVLDSNHTLHVFDKQ